MLLSLLLIALTTPSLLILRISSSTTSLWEVLLLLIIECLVVLLPSALASLLRSHLCGDVWADHLQKLHKHSLKLPLVHLIYVLKVRNHHLVRGHSASAHHLHQGVLHHSARRSTPLTKHSTHVRHPGSITLVILVIVPSIEVLLLTLRCWDVSTLGLGPVLRLLHPSGWGIVTGKLRFSLVYRLLLVLSRWHIN